MTKQKIIKIGTLDYEIHDDSDGTCGEMTCAFWDNCYDQCAEYNNYSSYFKQVEKEPIYPNANPHMDMIIAWSKDMTLKVEWSSDGEKWYPCGIPLWQPDVKFRFAPTSKTFFLKVASVDDELVVHHTGEKHADIKILMVEGKLVNVEKVEK